MTMVETTSGQMVELPRGFLLNGVDGNVRPVDFGLFPQDLFYSLLVYWGEGGYFVVSRVPAKESGPPAHTHQVDQIFVCVRGTLELRVGADQLRLTPGTLVVIPAGTPHEHWNTGDEEEVHLELILPGVVPSYPIVEFAESDSEWDGHGIPVVLQPEAVQAGGAHGDTLPGMLSPYRAGVARLAPGENVALPGEDAVGELYAYVLQGEVAATVGSESPAQAAQGTVVLVPFGLSATLMNNSSAVADVFIIWPVQNG